VKSYRVSSASFLLLCIAAITLACGTSSSGSRMLESVSVSPATADAQNYPGGQVPFVATGFYTTNPSTVTPLATVWGACYQEASTTDVLIDLQTGTATCKAGAMGTYTVFTSNTGGMHGGCNITSACGGGCFVTGTAQLTCP
jgi:hypothetical protein